MMAAYSGCHSISVIVQFFRASPMIKGQSLRQHSDLELFQEPDVEFPIAQHIVLLIEKPDCVVDTAPISKRDRRKQIAPHHPEKRDVFEIAIVVAPRYFRRTAWGDAFVDLNRVGYDALAAVIRPLLEKSYRLV